MAVDKIISFGGIGAERATFKIASDTEATEGMAVTFTGNAEVGVGTSGATVGGIIKTIDGNGLVGVQFKGFCEDVAITATVENQPSVGDYVAVDGAGALIKSTAPTNARVVAVDTTNLTATILF
jgi:hydrogenase maturation factor